MDGKRFDYLALSLGAHGSRRGLLRFVTGLPLGGGVALLGDEGTNAQGRRMRRKKRHKHGKGRHNEKRDKACQPDSTARTCVGKCGTVRNNCKKNVSCGACSAIASFSATADTIDRGAATPETAILTWTTTSATTCAIDNGVGSVPCNGSIEVGPSTTTTYTLSASGPGGVPDTEQATVTVQYCHSVEAFHAPCPSGATQFCLPEFISSTSSADAQAACEACYGEGMCTNTYEATCWQRTWSGPSSSTQAGYQYSDGGFASAGDIVGGIDSNRPCTPSGQRWTIGF